MQRVKQLAMIPPAVARHMEALQVRMVLAGLSASSLTLFSPVLDSNLQVVRYNVHGHYESHFDSEGEVSLEATSFPSLHQGRLGAEACV